MRRAADSIGARLGCVLEGGYALGALSRAVAATMEALVDGGGPVETGGELPPLVREARERVAKWWPGF